MDDLKFIKYTIIPKDHGYEVMWGKDLHDGKNEQLSIQILIPVDMAESRLWEPPERLIDIIKREHGNAMDSLGYPLIPF